MRLEFDVHGKPAGMGSKKAFFVKKLGRAVITDDNKPAKKNWENAVATAAAEAMAGRELITGPVWVQFVFRFARPKAHFRTGKKSHILSDSAPEFHINKPDFDKLCRLMADAMTGVVYRDDSQIWGAILEKQWTTGSEGAHVIVDSEPIVANRSVLTSGA